MPFVSVIIPVYNDAERLALCLNALSEQTYPRDRYEVIVVDNASTESVEPVVTNYPGVIYAYEEKTGSYAARNKGIGLARGSIFAFTDSDCAPRPNWLDEGVRKLLETPGCGLVGGRIELSFVDEQSPTAVELYEWLWAFQQDSYVERVGFSATANLLALREAFDKVGPFDANLKSGGDREWCVRAQAGGYVLAYAAEAPVRHPARRTLGELANKTLRISGGAYDRLKDRSEGSMRTQILHMLWWLRPPVRAVVRSWSRSEDMAVSMRFRLIGILLLVRGITFWERLRLLLGGESRR